MTPLILLSNDDGVYAKGLRELIDMLRPLGNLFVVAPDKARSGSACSLSSEIPVKADLLETSEGLTVYACSGTPVDCVKLALDQLLASRPDLIVGGINHGNNATINVHYSGTLGVALEGALQGIPSVAFSLCDRDPDADFDPLRPYVQRITSQALRQTLPYGSCLNVIVGFGWRGWHTAGGKMNFSLASIPAEAATFGLPVNVSMMNLMRPTPTAGLLTTNTWP